MRRKTLLAWCLGAALAVACYATTGVTEAQPPPAYPFKLTPLLKAPFAGDPNKEAVVVRLDWPANTSFVWHTHPGDEYATVLEGAIITQRKDEEPKTTTRGQSYHIPGGVVHTAKSGDKPAIVIVFLVVEKGKPVVQPANE
jgi:quercetin dioxygenase-like cupin family protein